MTVFHPFTMAVLYGVLAGVPDSPRVPRLHADDAGGGGGRDAAVQAVLHSVDRQGRSDWPGQGPQGGESRQ